MAAATVDEGHPEVVAEQRDAPAAARTRRCVATRASGPAGHMIRFVVAPDGALTPDLAARLPGRGLWVGASRATLAQAIARGQFAKAARAPVAADAALVDQVGEMLARRCLDLIGLARRAGELVAGFDQVGDWLRRRRVALVLTARDGAEEGRRRVAALAGDGVVPVLDPFDRRELGGVLGREEAVHVALAEGGLARQLLGELERLRGFREFSMPRRRRDADSNAATEGASRT